MARGKYSPTVNAAYMADQEWWTKYSGANLPSETYVQFDPDGYDSYGYNSKGYDRAGNHENDYLHNDGDWDRDEDFNYAYDQACDDWHFDGVKPVKVHPR